MQMQSPDPTLLVKGSGTRSLVLMNQNCKLKKKLIFFDPKLQFTYFRHVFMRLYKQYERPHLEFSTQDWSPWTEGDKACLEKVPQRAVRMVS
jgi:hypothetical protein